MTKNAKSWTVGLRPKPYTKPRLTGKKLADHPAMKELARMIEAGEVDRDRTLAYLAGKVKTPRKPGKVD